MQLTAPDSTMNILFNFIPIKRGGGQQVATSFINVLKDLPEFTNSTFLATEGTEVQKLLSKYNAPNLVIVPNTILKRLKFERSGLKELVKTNKLDIIFTMFGTDLPKVGIPSIVGCAYSNLFFPEIDFWKDYAFHQRFLFKLIDKFRIKRTFQADGIVFENSSMMKRSHKLFNYPGNQTVFIKPSISKKQGADVFTDEVKALCNTLPKHFKVILLSTWQKNKNMHQIPFILQELHKQGIFDVSFIMTVSKDHPLSVELLAVAQKLGVEKNIIMIGSVKPTDVPYLYQNIDVTLLISNLESFSNNIIESWTFTKPLVISNLEWAKTICNDAAIYVDPTEAKDIADKIATLKADEHLYTKVINNGLKEIETYPSPEEKVSLQLDFIANTFNRFKSKV